MLDEARREGDLRNFRGEEGVMIMSVEGGGASLVSGGRGGSGRSVGKGGVRFSKDDWGGSGMDAPLRDDVRGVGIGGEGRSGKRDCRPSTADVG